MNISIGDKVRFLNEVGGGKVTRIEGNLVFVEDEDGFEIPVPQNEAVVVEKVQVYSEKDIGLLEKISPSNLIKTDENIDDSNDETIEEIFEDESHDDADPKIYLAFITTSSVIDVKSKISVFLVNDSNYFCYYTISEKNDSGLLTLLLNGNIDPNTKLTIDEKEVEQFDTEWVIQLILFKKTKSYIRIEPISTSVSLNQNRFFKRNAFEANDFFYQSALLISLLKNELEKSVESITIEETDKIIEEKEVVVPQKSAIKRADTVDLLEIDLHIHELLDNCSGLSNSEMLKIQLDKFNSVMEENKNNKGKKVVFIHGVGNGTLKTEIRTQLNKKYKGLYYLDASFKEYGFGATMVVM